MKKLVRRIQSGGSDLNAWLTFFIFPWFAVRKEWKGTNQKGAQVHKLLSIGVHMNAATLRAAPAGDDPIGEISGILGKAIVRLKLRRLGILSCSSGLSENSLEVLNLSDHHGLEPALKGERP